MAQERHTLNSWGIGGGARTGDEVLLSLQLATKGVSRRIDVCVYGDGVIRDGHPGEVALHASFKSPAKNSSTARAGRSWLYRGLHELAVCRSRKFCLLVPLFRESDRNTSNAAIAQAAMVLVMANGPMRVNINTTAVLAKAPTPI